LFGVLALWRLIEGGGKVAARISEENTLFREIIPREVGGECCGPMMVKLSDHFIIVGR
jgi:hypothetical protein